MKANSLDLVEPVSQVDPSFKTTFRYTRITAEGLHAALIEEKGWRNEDLPYVSTLRNIPNHLGYRLRRMQKTKPLKKNKKTDAIFANVHTLNKEADANPLSLEDFGLRQGQGRRPRFFQGSGSALH